MVMIRGRHTPLDYLFFLRPVLLPPVWTIALLGTVRQEMPLEQPLWSWLVFFLHLSALFGGVYTLNQICDVESDRLNRKLHFLPEGLISLPAAWRFTIALNALALTLAAIFGWRYLLLTVFVVVLGILYSAGKSPWKNHAWLGLAANVLGHGPAVFLFGFLLTECPLVVAWQAVPAYAFAVGAVYLATTVPDIDGDKRTGKTTAAVRWGIRRTLAVSCVLVTAAIALSYWGDDRYLMWAALAALPLFAYAMARPQSASLAAKSAIVALSVAAVIAYPLYAILLLAGFVGTRLFFHWRFGTTYPTFV